MDAGFAQTQAFLTTGGMAAIGLVGALIATVLVETTGRKPLLAIAAVTGSILLVIVAAFLHVPAAVLPLVLVYGLIIQIAIPVMYAYASELYPTSLRSSGFDGPGGLPTSAGIGPLLFRPTRPGFDDRGIYLRNGHGGAGRVMFILAPETTGKDLQD